MPQPLKRPSSPLLITRETHPLELVYNRPPRHLTSDDIVLRIISIFCLMVGVYVLYKVPANVMRDLSSSKFDKIASPLLGTFILSIGALTWKYSHKD